MTFYSPNKYYLKKVTNPNINIRYQSLKQNDQGILRYIQMAQVNSHWDG